MTVMSRSRHGSNNALPPPATLSPNRPKGNQLREVLERLATELGPGHPIPSERCIAEHFGIARGTVRQVISHLVATGKLYRRPGNATFTAEAPGLATGLPDHPPAGGQAPGMVTSFTADMRACGLVPATVLLSSAIQPATAELAGQLEIDPDSPIFRLERLRLVNGEPLAIERTHLPIRRFPGIETLDWQSRSLHETLWERYRVRPERNESSITAMLPGPEDAARLDMTENQPCLLIAALARAADNSPIEVGRSLYRADRHAVFARFHRSP